MTTALITGITGQDGRYLAMHLNSLGYEVYGLLNGQNTLRSEYVRQNLPYVKLIPGDLRDFSSLLNALEKSNPDEVYNLGAVSYVGISWGQPEQIGDVNALGVLRILEAIRYYTKGEMKKIKFYQASSSEMFGKVEQVPQKETTLLHPRSPYGVAKTYGHYITMNHRESYNAFACSGILFNHESPLRGDEFVTRKITKAVARIKLKKQDRLLLGNLDAKRDWGYSGDYVKAMHLMLQHHTPDDYVIATGITHTVREMCEKAFSCVGIKNWEDYIGVDRNYMRPADVELLIGDPSKAKSVLGWKPEVDFDKLVEMMVESDLNNESRAW